MSQFLNLVIYHQWIITGQYQNCQYLIKPETVLHRRFTDYRQSGCLVCFSLQGRLPANTAQIYFVPEELRGYCSSGWGLTASLFDLLSLTPLSVASCGRLQLGVANLATSVAFMQVTDPSNSGKWFYSDGLLRLHIFFTVTMHILLYSDEILAKIWTFWVSM